MLGKEPVLADSSFYIGQMRQRRDPLPLLLYLAEDRDLATCGVVRAEVGRGLRTLKVREALGQAWDVMICVPTDNKLWAKVEQLAWTLDRRGMNLPLQDLIIGCCALQLDAVVLTCDRHFSSIPGLKVAYGPRDL